MLRVILLCCCFYYVCISLAQTSTYKSKQKTNPYQLLKKLEDKKLLQLQKKLDSLTTHTLPKDAKIIKHDGFISAYSTQHKQPYWVAHIVPKDILYGSYTRNEGFITDSLLLNQTADSTDFLGSGYDRGHLAPAADFRWHKKLLSESFYYTNIAPQLTAFNRGAWAKLETMVREFAIDANEVYIITGSILHQKLPKLLQGSYQVSVPYYFYKIVYDLYPPNYKAIAFLMPNKEIAFDLELYKTTVDSIEQLTGIDFLPILDDAIEKEIEQQKNIKDWDKNYTPYIDSVLNRNFGNDKLNTLQAKDNLGNYCTVCGKAVAVKYIENGKSNPTYINLDKKFPNQLFTVVIYQDIRTKLGYNPEEKFFNKTICVKGKVEQYKGTPQIVLYKEKDIFIYEE